MGLPALAIDLPPLQVVANNTTPPVRRPALETSPPVFLLQARLSPEEVRLLRSYEPTSALSFEVMTAKMMMDFRRIEESQIGHITYFEVLRFATSA